MAVDPARALVVGVDFGTLSGRALVVRVADGAELGSAVHPYAHGVVDDRLPTTGVRLPPDWALQVPSDYIDVLRNAVPEAIRSSGADRDEVIGIATDFTACTMVPTTEDGIPLCELPQFAGRPHSYVKLWKHHAAQGQADRINDLAAKRGESWLPRYGDLGDRAGNLSARAAEWTRLPEGIAVAAGNVDAHVTNPAGQAIEPGQMVAIMGTSTCHTMNSDQLHEVPGMCGVVDGGITKGLWGYEAGQSGVGDIFGWFVHNSVPEGYATEARSRGIGLHELLTEKAAAQQVGEHGLLALDWHSGNRSILVDHELSGMIVGQTLATKPEDIYRALIEATAFGARTVVEAFNQAGVPVREFVVAGGLIKNAFLMQIYADVLNMPLSVVSSEQAPALGSAIHAAVAAGAYPDVAAASAVMGRAEKNVYQPIKANVASYDELFEEYRTLHDYFGRGENKVMHHLRDVRRRAHGGE
jgi:ribulose kinase